MLDMEANEVQNENQIDQTQTALHRIWGRLEFQAYENYRDDYLAEHYTRGRILLQDLWNLTVYHRRFSRGELPKGGTAERIYYALREAYPRFVEALG